MNKDERSCDMTCTDNSCQESQLFLNSTMPDPGLVCGVERKESGCGVSTCCAPLSNTLNISLDKSFDTVYGHDMALLNNPVAMAQKWTSKPKSDGFLVLSIPDVTSLSKGAEHEVMQVDPEVVQKK